MIFPDPIVLTDTSETIVRLRCERDLESSDPKLEDQLAMVILVGVEPPICGFPVNRDGVAAFCNQHQNHRGDCT
jgi:hypothetical protein